MKPMTQSRAAVASLAVLLLMSATASAGAEPPSAPSPLARKACAQRSDRVRCFAQTRLNATGQPFTTISGPSAGYLPNDIQAAYGIDPNRETDATVAIVDAFDDPTAESDLAAYRAYFGLPACTTANGCFRKVNQYGHDTGLPSPPPADDDDWSVEVSLDLDAVSSACPHCKILLVEAEDDFGIPYSYSVNLILAQSTAVRLGATVVSNSWGNPEIPGQQLIDATYFNHPGVAIFASAGDDGYLVAYPASSPYVIAVGGTSLYPDNSARGFRESVWAGTGSGCSTMESQPSWQHTNVTNCSGRAMNDVSAVADPNTGLAIYDTANGNGGWMVVGGTSLSSPLTAAIFAGTGNGAETAKFIYDNAAKFHDVKTGSNGTCSPGIYCNAQEGWDAPTGVGTPDFVALTALSKTTTPPAKGGGGCTLGDIWSGITQLACFIPMQLFRARRLRKRERRSI